MSHDIQPRVLCETGYSIFTQGKPACVESAYPVYVRHCVHSGSGSMYHFKASSGVFCISALTLMVGSLFACPYLRAICSSRDNLLLFLYAIAVEASGRHGLLSRLY